MEIPPPLWTTSKDCTMLVWWFNLCFLKNSLGLNLIWDAAWSVPSSSGEALPSTGFQGPPRPWSATRVTADLPCCPPGLQPFCPDQGPHSLLRSSQPGQDISFAQAVLQEVHGTPFLQPVEAPLKGCVPLQLLPQCGTIPSALHPLFYVVDKDVKNTGLVLTPEKWHV